jgi:hypothetical protein
MPRPDSPVGRAKIKTALASVSIPAFTFYSLLLIFDFHELAQNR